MAERDLVALVVADLEEVNTMGILEHPNRTTFFRKMGLKWFNVCPIDELTGLPNASNWQPYGMYHCQKIPKSQIHEMKAASEVAGKIIRKVWQVIRGLEDNMLLELGFPLQSLKVVKADNFSPFTMRLDWSWNHQTGEKKIIEINCQTPNFLFECLEGNKYAANYFGMRDPNPEAIDVVRASLTYQLTQAANELGKNLSDCTIGFTALNNVEDIGTMNWLANQAKKLGFKATLFPLEFLSVVERKGIWYTKNNQRIDILFMWYPLEWAIYDRDEKGDGLWAALENVILQKQAIVINFASGFVLQPKTIFSLITDLGADFFAEDANTILKYFPKTSTVASEIGSSYFAKPILGRQGEGGYAVYKDDILVESSGNAEWYTQQQYIYQELLDLPTINIEEVDYTCLWGSWLFNVSEEFIPAGVGMRVSVSPITDDYSYYLPIGV